MSTYNDFVSRKNEEGGDELLYARGRVVACERKEALGESKGVYAGDWTTARASVEV